MCVCVYLIGASRSEPHTNHHYEKIAVLMYVPIYLCRDMSSTCSCIYLFIYVAIRRPCVRHARAHTHSARGNDHYWIKFVHIHYNLPVHMES